MKRGLFFLDTTNHIIQKLKMHDFFSCVPPGGCCNKVACSLLYEQSANKKMLQNHKSRTIKTMPKAKFFWLSKAQKIRRNFFAGAQQNMSSTLNFTDVYADQKTGSRNL